VSQRHAGWVALADMYDDGGLSGGTMERPALPNASRKACDKSCFVLAAGNKPARRLLECVMIELFEDKAIASSVNE
jgi:hypothetical protein